MRAAVVLCAALSCTSCTKQTDSDMMVFDAKGNELVRVQSDGTIGDAHKRVLATRTGDTVTFEGQPPTVVRISEAVAIDEDTYTVRGMVDARFRVSGDGVIHSANGQTWGRVEGYSGDDRRTRLAAALVVIPTLQPTSPKRRPAPPDDEPPPPPSRGPH